ncbi:TolC family outer membrane protein [Burkholderia stagnalis]|uniref:Anibiotic ABC transporter n=1 Tax=Burkholderia stagnalis TaxID=1503054 RepID=A0A108GCC0_9BURK|nr:TolC family outer membrane protein [Burkholderia stagnalis]KVZ13600.1 anibiotic ABC transporter [Burkholderia stagnalis]KWA52227.1 anibiotic ABC transporter [Burkholderia stagnalis]KWA57429.1 anibiotic ABC transporter [Burkholderia stagnalis]KWA62390.1 anibiotic ABC transporter [Burkholderia stagnalis]KWC95067.1 anibiotic ABC transporter [Burkholderia stagnalis]
MKHWIRLTIALAPFSVAFPAQSADLLDAVVAARGFDAGIAAAGNARLAGREKRWQGLAGLLPRAQIDGNYTKQDQPSAPYAAAVRRHSVSATITQPIFDVSRVAEFKRGGTLADQADIEFEKARQTLITDVSDAYFDVLYGREVLQAAESAQQAFQRQLDQAQAALRIGDGTRTDVDEARANLDDALARKVSAQNDLEIASGALRRLTGLAADAIAPIAWQCAPQAPPVDLAAAMDEAARYNVDVRIAAKQAEQAQADVVAAAGANLPVVNLQASYGTNWSRGSGENDWDQVFGTTSKSRSSMIGVTVTIPLFAGGGQLSASREAYRLRAQSRDALEDARRKARERARTAYLGITNGVALMRARERALASADSKVKSTHLGREVGLRTQIDELNAQQRYFEAIRDLADARYRYLRARLQLSAALGTLGDADVAAIACRNGG